MQIVRENINQVESHGTFSQKIWTTLADGQLEAFSKMQLICRITDLCFYLVYYLDLMILDSYLKAKAFKYHLVTSFALCYLPVA